MDDHRSRKRRRHARQEESTTRYAAKPAQAADIGRGSPAARRRGTDGAAAETRVRSHMKVPAAGHGYVYDWLAGVAAMEGEQQAQTYSPANRPSPPTLTKTRGFRHASPERCDETVPDGRTDRGRRRDSSDSSLVRPAYEGGELSLQRETEEGEDTGEDQTGRISKKAKKHKQSVYSTTVDSQSEPDLPPQHKETFEKRSRHKTREDRYESKKAKKYVIENDKLAKKKTIKVKRGDAARASRKAGEDLINGFRSKHVVQDRLTMRPGTGIFKNGRASSPSRNRGLPDLAFSEMQFLKQSSRRPPDSEKEVIISKSGQKTKRERERARNEISNYFIPARQPLQGGGVNRGREVSVLPSDAGKTEDTSVLRGQYFQPPASPGEDERDEKALYSHFSARRTSPQKFSLPKPKLDQIFVPRNMTASSKSTSHCTWSESVRSPLTHGKAVLADASRFERGMSSTSRQRTAMAGDYKEVGVQAKLDPANPLSAGSFNDQNRTENNDEDSMNQFQADRAVLHDCEPHRRSERLDGDNSGEHLELLHAETSVGLKQGEDRAEQRAADKCTQTGINGRPQDNPTQPDQTNTDLEVQTIMSRAILAQQAYIKRRSTPKVAVEEDAGLPNMKVQPTDVPNATDSGAPKEVSGSLEIDRQGDSEASHLLSGLIDGRQNEESGCTGQDQEPISEYSLPIHGQTQSEYVDAAVYQLNEPDDSGDYITGEHDLHEIENAAIPGHSDPPQFMIPTRGFSTGAVRIPPVQPRTISPLETMEPIYARQLQSRVFDAHEGQHDLYDAEERGPSEILLYEGGQWERAEALQGYNPTTMENGEMGYGDVYEGQQYGLDLIDESMYYEGGLPIDPEAQMHDTAAPEGMLFYSQANGPSTEYQWMPRQRTHFSAVTDQVSGLGSWERVQTAAVPRELTMQFWRPRSGY
ncbi:hypothetical protein V492_08332 [Pseudogymnoascus sp. VKM F-4246]|nr:hypothetical protein V492_08332 [Pseudogymnoascus sp. VKM F-4246]